MSFSYSGDPSKSSKDQVRFLLGDTNANNPLLNDAEINYLISTEGGALSAAVAGAIAIAAQFSRLQDESVGDVSKSFSQKHDHYLKLAKSLRQRNAEKAVCPYAGGISESDKQVLEADTDAVKPAFSKTLHSDPQMIDDPETDC